MAEKPAGETPGHLRVLAAVAVIALVLYAFQHFFGRLTHVLLAIVPVFLAGFVMAYILDPLIDYLERRKWSRLWAVSAVFGTFFVLFAGLVVVLVTVITGQVQRVIVELPRYSASLSRWVEQQAQQLPQLASPEVQERIRTWIAEQTPRLTGAVTAGLSRMTNWLLGSFSALITYIILPLVTFYFLRDFDRLKGFVVEVIPLDRREASVTKLREVNAMVGQYIRGQFLLACCVGLTDAAVLTILAFIFHSQYALFIALIGGLGYVVPYVGPIVTAVSATTVAYFTGMPAAAAAVTTFVCVVAVNQVYDSIVTPRTIGRRTNLHPLTIIFTLMVAGGLFGVLGMIVAVPVAGTIKILLAPWLPRPKEEAQPQPALAEEHKASEPAVYAPK